MFYAGFDMLFSILFPILSRHHTDNTMMHTFTTYYATFQVESGDRMELEVDGSDYGMLVEGDIGKLMFQGTRYLGFERR